MKFLSFLLLIILATSCLKVKKIHGTLDASNFNGDQIGTGDPDLSQSILPETVDLTVTRKPSWQMTIKNAQGEVLQGVTPTVEFFLSNYPLPLNPKANFTCSASDSHGVSTCASDMESFSPGSFEVKVTIGPWTQPIPVNISCPQDWSEVNIGYNITSPNSLIDTAEKFELLRCNQSDKTYYVKDIDFSASPDYFYYPIQIKDRVSIEFGELSNLTVTENPLYTNGAPSLFIGANDEKYITGLDLRGLKLSHLSYSSDQPKSIYGIIAPHLIDSRIINLEVSDSTIDMGSNAVGDGIGLFEKISSTTPGASSVINLQIIRNQLISGSIPQSSFLAHTLDSVTVTKANFEKNLIIGTEHHPSGLVSSQLLGAIHPQNKLHSITITDNYILTSKDDSTSVIGAITGSIPSGSHPLITDTAMDGFNVIGTDTANSYVGGLIGVMQGSVYLDGGNINELALYARNTGGLIGSIDSSEQTNIANFKIFVEALKLREPWEINPPSHFIPINLDDYKVPPDTEIPSHLSTIGGIAAEVYLTGTSIILENNRITLSATTEAINRVGGIFAHLLTRVGAQDSSFSGSNLEIITTIDGDSAMTSPLFTRASNAGGPLNISLSDVLVRSLTAPAGGLASPTNPSFIFFLNSELPRTSTSLTNFYVYSKREDRDCVNTTMYLGNIQKCTGPGTDGDPDDPKFLDFQVKWTNDSTAFIQSSNNEYFLLDDTLWNLPDDSGDYLRLK